MRYLLLTVCLFTFITACNKSNTYSKCDMTQVDVLDEVAPYYLNYQYDAGGRIKKIISTTYTNSYNYEYFADSVVLITTLSLIPSYTRTTYYLNSAGLATSAKTIFSPNPNGLQIDDLYTYDAAGYLVAERSIFSQVYNGNIQRDTTFKTYTVLNGDIIKKTETNSPDITYEYTGDALPDNIPFLNEFPSREGSFLGKHPNHLISRVIIAGSSATNYSYSFDKGKKVSEMRITGPGITGTEKVVFHYACD